MGFIKGCRVGRDNMMVSHLQFADNTFFFVELEEVSFKNLLIIVAMFCSVSGLKINMGKSTILGMGVDDEIVTSIAHLVDCEVGLWPTKYLGMPLGENPCCGDFLGTCDQ